MSRRRYSLSLKFFKCVSKASYAPILWSYSSLLDTVFDTLPQDHLLSARPVSPVYTNQ